MTGKWISYQNAVTGTVTKTYARVIGWTDQFVILKTVGGELPGWKFPVDRDALITPESELV